MVPGSSIVILPGIGAASLGHYRRSRTLSDLISCPSAHP
jgi:hypothetical protein